MSMDKAVLAFNTQFAFQPEIVNAEALVQKSQVIVCGMGGSHLAADIIKLQNEQLPITIHSDYGLDRFSDEILQNSLIIASSYSGNTEEVLSCYAAAKEKGLSLAVVAVGGKLIEYAQADGIPYVQMPNTGIQPRSALGLSFRALLKIMGMDDVLTATDRFVNDLDPAAFEARGKAFATAWKGKVPVIYSSRKNYAIAYNWKIKCNETGKIPTVYNIFPELNHNEMNGFDVADSTQELSDRFQFVFLCDDQDHPRVQKRMMVCAQLYRERGLAVEEITLEGGDRLERVFTSLILADWVAVHTAGQYGLEAEQVPMIEEFKKLIVE